MSKKVLVLGCGPAGLFAAHAAEMAGYDPIIASKKRKSEMYGAQYLHEAIPEATGTSPFQVSYITEGPVDGYRDKVYGPDFRGTVSPEDLQGNHVGWDIRSTYDILWMRYQGKIINFELTNIMDVESLMAEHMPAHVISSVPAPLLCSNPGHQFVSQDIWAIGDAPERGIFSPITKPLNTVVCNGNYDVSWYRAANILGYHTVEWPFNKRPPIEGLAPVKKPLGTNCDCLTTVHRVGRYGRWEKGVLSHTAFFETYAGLGGS